MRIGAAREATRKLLSALDKSKHGRQSGITLGPSNVDDVYQEVNRLKHDLRGLSKDRWVTFEQAMQALDELVSVLDGRKNELSNPNTKSGTQTCPPFRFV